MTKTEVIRARVTQDEQNALLLIARQDRRKTSEMLRELVREEAKRRGVWPPPVQEQEENHLKVNL